MSKNIHPLISVIIPTYNVDKYLNKCLQSISEQSYNNLLLSDKNFTKP